MARSRFAGLYNAIDFAYGVSPVFAPPLSMLVGNAASGSVSVVLNFMYTTLLDGSVVYPLNTNAPVTVGIGANAETITPSAVSNNGLPGYGVGGFTATFSNVHGIGEPVSSGTFGLQEAINAASAAGGGTVLVDGRWAALGGTTAIINAAVLPTNDTVAIWDNRGGSGAIQSGTFTLNNTQVKALFSAPVKLLPAPGTTSMYDIIDCVFENVGTVAYANGGAIQLSYDTGTTVAASATVAATFLTSPTAPQMIKVAGALASTLSSSVLNKAIYVAAATADFITGTGTMIIKPSYRVLSGF